MPFFRCNDQMHYFAHVPKCAGQSVEAYLETRFGALAFIDNRFYKTEAADRWTASSPQHVAWGDLMRLVPRDWIASVFAVVRNPYARVVSAYNFAAQAQGKVRAGQDIVGWLERNLPERPRDGFVTDNHLLPQVRFMPEDAVVFRMEDGLDPLVAHLDTIAGNTDGARAIGHDNPKRDLSAKFTKRAVPADFYELAAKVYAEDFVRFGYDPAHHPALSYAMPARGPATVARAKSALRGITGASR